MMIVIAFAIPVVFVWVVDFFGVVVSAFAAAAAVAFKMPLGVWGLNANVIQRNKKWKLKISGRARIPIFILLFLFFVFLM